MSSTRRIKIKDKWMMENNTETKIMKKNSGSPDRFGYEFDKFSEIIPNYEKQFLEWCHPLKPKDFKGKSILDGGCGVGRNSYWPLTYGAKNALAFDFDGRSVNAAKHNLRDYPNAEVEFGSLYEPIYTDKFDIAFSIGVIHHLEFPRQAIQTLVQATKPGGTVFVWVYGYEGVGSWVVKYINPVRVITSRLPLRLTLTLSYFCSVPLYIFLKTIPQKNKYFKQLSGFSFWHLSHIIFDQLLPRIANYWTKEEAKSLLENQGLEDIKIYKTNDISWTVVGKKKGK